MINSFKINAVNITVTIVFILFNPIKILDNNIIEIPIKFKFWKKNIILTLV